MTILEKIFYSLIGCGGFALFLVVMCALAWMRDAASERKDIP